MSAARRRVVLGAVFVGLLGPAAASAHVTVAPQRIAPGAEALLVFSAPNERDQVPVVGLAVTLPTGFVVGSIGTVPGWSATAGTLTASWRGGRIPPGQFAQFPVRVVAPDRRGAVDVTAVERFADGRTSTFHPRLDLRPPVATSVTPGRDSAARTLGKFALGVAVAAALLAVGVGFLALRNWLSLPEPDDETGEPRSRRGRRGATRGRSVG